MTAIPFLPQPSLSAQSAEALVAAVQLGELRQYAHLVTRYSQRLYRLVIAMGVAEADTDEVLRHTFLRAFQQLEQFAGQEKCSAWLSRIAMNECQVHQHRARHKPLSGAEALWPEWPERLVDLVSPERQLQHQEIKHLLEKAVQALPQGCRLVFVLREVQALGKRATARLLQLDDAGVAARLAHARLLLRDLRSEQLRPQDLFVFSASRAAALSAEVLQCLGLADPEEKPANAAW